MTRDEGVALIKEQLGFRTTLDTEIVRYLKLAQTTLEHSPDKPWFLISEDSFTVTVADEERIAVPDDFLAEVDDATFKYRPDDWPTTPEEDLDKDEYDVLRRNFREESPGIPQAYALLGSYFRIFPTPDDVYTVRLIYYKTDVVLDTNVENGWLREIPLLLLGSAGQLIANPVRDKTAFDTFGAWIATGLKILHGHATERDVANRTLQIGGPAT